MKSKNNWNMIAGVVIPKQFIAKHLGITRQALDKRIDAGISEKDIESIEECIRSLGLEFLTWSMSE